VNELDVVAFGNEAEFHAFGFFGNGQCRAASDFADVVLGEFAEGEFAARKLVLRESPEEVGLILGWIERAKELEAIRRDVVAYAGVMSGSEAICADLAGHAKEWLKLYVGVAVGAGNGRASGEVVADKRAHHALLELVLEVDNVVGKLQMLGDALGVVDVVKRTAAMLSRAVSLEFRQSALIPELHREADDRSALLLKDGSHGRGIYAAGHGNSDKAGLTGAGLRQRRFDLC